MQVTIENKEYTLKFGFGFLRKLGEIYLLESYQEVIDLLASKLDKFDNITFEQEDVLRHVLAAAADNADCKNKSGLDGIDLMQFMLTETKTFQSIIEQISKSFPQNTGKPRANKPVRKPLQKKD